ncbi:hypothetical protein QBC39DRAFT_129313 [Podospora conica]|nr:hypothetical protein QBC39DRAFT_129313 [Schizothecium conicum]
MPREGRRETRGAPRPRPSVEIWLDSVPPSTSKPSPEELRQWDLDERGHSGRSFFITTVVLRATSLIAAFTVVIVSLTIIVPDSFYYSGDLVPTLIACFLTAAWDASEFGIMYFRGGQCLPWWSHITADGAAVLGIAITAGFSFANLPRLISNNSYVFYHGGDTSREVASLALSVLLILIHSSLFVRFLLARLRGRAEKQKTEPRIMYLPTGDPVVVTQEPIPPPAAVTAPSPTSPTLTRDPRTSDSIHEPFRQGVPPRKPVAGAPGGTYPSQWPGPDYQPDEAERARAARGELQAQCIPIQSKGLRHEMVTMADQGALTTRART